MKILVLGGYGQAGRLFCKYLLQETNASVIISGRNNRKAARLKQALSQQFDPSRIETLALDASFHQDLRIGFRRCDMVLVASTTADYAQRIASEALAAGIHYVDIYYRQGVYHTIKNLHSAAIKKHLCFVTQAGLYPGLPSAYIRNGARFFDTLDTVNVALTSNFKVGEHSSIYELMDSMADMERCIYQHGAWKRRSFWKYLKVDFGEGFGKKSCVPLYLHELQPIPELFEVEEVGFYTSGFNWFTDWLVFPLLTLSQKIKRGLFRSFWANALSYGLNRFVSGKEGVVFKLMAQGTKNGNSHKLTIRSECDNAYLFTVYPVISYIKQFLQSPSPTPGVYMMGHLINTQQLFNDLNRLG